MTSFPLTGIRVLEFGGIGPAPLGCCVLADFGADVITISRCSKGRINNSNDPVSRGKRSIAMDLKTPEAIAALIDMVKNVDVVVEPFRPGVMERLGLGPDVLCTANPRLIYARMTGWGQTGSKEYVHAAGHDSNYIGLSGALELFRRSGERPLPPANFAGDYAGGGMMLAMGVLLALLERTRSGHGQVIDVAMTEGANYVALPLFKWLQGSMVLRKQEDTFLDPNRSFLHQSPPWSNVYACADGKWISVQAIEPQFYKQLLEGLDLSDEADLPAQYDMDAWPWVKARFVEIFKTKTRDEWEQHFAGRDACVAPVLSTEEAARHPHNVARASFAPTPENLDLSEPVPAPRLSRTPGHLPRAKPIPGHDTVQVLRDLGLGSERVHALLEQGVIASDKSQPKPRSKSKL